MIKFDSYTKRTIRFDQLKPGERFMYNDETFMVTLYGSDCEALNMTDYSIHCFSDYTMVESLKEIEEVIINANQLKEGDTFIYNGLHFVCIKSDSDGVLAFCFETIDNQMFIDSERVTISNFTLTVG